MPAAESNNCRDGANCTVQLAVSTKMQNAIRRVQRPRALTLRDIQVTGPVNQFAKFQATTVRLNTK
jgi:hypothetical protein